MYIDFDIAVPKQIRALRPYAAEEIELLEQAYLAEDEITYLLHEDSVMGYIKQCADDRVISESELDQLFKRFGWRV
ncbi:MAG: hypothetical protein HFH33_10420 [Eubacterium sp.]|jgi:hypothetical protein|nr:hypothetical protein [Eubacterium sp.]